MPKGVEHVEETPVEPVVEKVFYPLMPKGVEHIDLLMPERLWYGVLSVDAERR